MDFNVDLANNTDIKKTIIDLLQIIVSIENSCANGEKPVLNELKRNLIKTYGEILMTLYLLDPN